MQISLSYETSSTFQAPTLADGTYGITVSRVDAAGNVSAPSAGRTVKIDTHAPTITVAQFEYQTQHRVSLTFNESLASFSDASFDILSRPGNTPLSKSMVTTFNGAQFTFGGLLTDGNYRLVPVAGQIMDPAGNVMAPHAFDFFALAGDANRDRVVNLVDLVQVATHWFQSGMTFSQGDFDYNGAVNSVDLGILAMSWQRRLDWPLPFANKAEGGLINRPPTRTPARMADSVL